MVTQGMVLAKQLISLQLKECYAFCLISLWRVPSVFTTSVKPSAPGPTTPGGDQSHCVMRESEHVVAILHTHVPVDWGRVLATWGNRCYVTLHYRHAVSNESAGMLCSAPHVCFAQCAWTAVVVQGCLLLPALCTNDGM